MKKFCVIFTMLLIAALLPYCGKMDQAEKVAAPNKQATDSSPVKIVPWDQLTVKPELVKSVTPKYPEKARKNDLQGKVILQVTILADGSIEAVDVLQSSGHALLDSAAVEAVRQFQFKPALVDGKPVATQTVIPFSFKLK